MIEDLGGEEGLQDFKKPTKIALIDADTLVYAACSVNEYAEDLLPEDMYTQEEWAELISDPLYDEKEHCIWFLNESAAINAVESRIEEIKEATFTASVELYFTSGKNFRHTVHDMYKGNRANTRYPTGLKSLKDYFTTKYPGEIGDGVEADDIVVYLKRTQPDKYVLCAVDKDVLNSVPGKHWNYYASAKYKIEPKWKTTTKEEAELFPYFQTLMGDSTDNIRGCPGVGKKTAAKLLAKAHTAEERWQIVTDTFKSKGLTVKDAIRDMRLINMHQVARTPAGKYIWMPWTQPIGGIDE